MELDTAVNLLHSRLRDNTLNKASAVSSLSCDGGLDGGRFSARELLARDATDFIRCVFLSVLGREPDPTGLKHFSNALSSGNMSKFDVLTHILCSPEAMQRKVVVTGITSRQWFVKVTNIPFLGAFIAGFYFVTKARSILLRLRVLEQRVAFSSENLEMLNSSMDTERFLRRNFQCSSDALYQEVAELRRRILNLESRSFVSLKRDRA